MQSGMRNVNKTLDSITLLVHVPPQDLRYSSYSSTCTDDVQSTFMCGMKIHEFTSKT